MPLLLNTTGPPPLGGLRTASRIGTRASGDTDPSATAWMTSPDSRSAVPTSSTITVDRAISAESSSRAVASCAPTAMTTTSSRSGAESNTGSRDVVAHTTTSASRSAAATSGVPAVRRVTTVTAATSPTARSVSSWPTPCGPAPKTTTRSPDRDASSGRTAATDTAGVRSVVSAAPSSSARGRSVSASNST
jgi:hypothetical protein